MRYALDSDIIIALLKGDPDAIRFLSAHQDVRTTTISALEILSGTRIGSRRERAADIMLEALAPLQLGMDETREAANVVRDLQKRGTSIGRFDETIAGICIANGATLVTRNAKHFSKVKGLKTEKW